MAEALPQPQQAREVVPTLSNTSMPEANKFVGISANNMIIKGDLTSVMHIQPIEHQEGVMFQVKDPIQTFIGRNKEREKIHRCIQKCKNQDVKISILSQIVAVTGKGGIGKTETVRMYIKEYGQEYDSIVWIDAEQPSEIISQFKHLAEHHLKIRVKEQNGNNIELSNILSEIYQKLSKSTKLLIIFDNAKALDDTGSLKDGIRQFLPAQTTAIEPPIVLVTSRHKSWKEMNEINLDLWDIEECIRYICKRLKLQDTPENQKDANEMALLFNRVPIAIEFAVAGILEQSSEQNRRLGDQAYSIQNLISYHNTGESDLNENEYSIPIEATVHKLLHVSLEQIKRFEHGQLALRILSFMAYLAPTNIPKVIIQWSLEETDEDAVDRALALLMRYSIIQRCGTSFTMQSVFQDAVIKSLQQKSISGSNNITLFSECTNEITVLGELTDTFLIRMDIEDLSKGEYTDIISNIIHTSEYIVQHSLTGNFYSYVEAVAALKFTPDEVAIKYYTVLLNYDININKLPPTDSFTKLRKIATIYFNGGKYQKALDIFSTLLRGGEMINPLAFNSSIVLLQGQVDVFGALHPATLETKDAIAYCFNLLVKPQDTLKVYWEVLGAREKLFGSLHLSTLFTKSNLAVCLSDQGKLDEALKLHYDVLAAREKLLGDTHADTLTTKDNIASCLSNQGKLEESLKMYKEVLKKRENVHGALHPYTLETKNNIAVVLGCQGKNEAALKLHYEVLGAQEMLLGKVHPSTLITKSYIATCLKDLERPKEAIEIYKYVLEFREKPLGIYDHATMSIQINIAFCLRKQGENEKALKLFHDVLDARQKEFGEFDPRTLDTKTCIAVCLKNLKRNNEALKLYYDILKEAEKIHGANHTYTLGIKDDIATCLNNQGNVDEALKLYNDILEEKMKTFGAFNTKTSVAKNNVAVCLLDQGKTDEALKLFYEVLAVDEKLLGSSHRHTLTTQSNIAMCLKYKGQEDEALKLNNIVLEGTEKLLGALHPDTLATKNNIAGCLCKQGNQKKGLKIYYDVLKAREKILGAHHPDTLTSKNNIAFCLSQQGKQERALKLFYHVLHGRMQVLGHHHPLTLRTKIDIAACLSEQRKLKQAQEIYYEVLLAQEELLGPLHPDTLSTKSDLARCLLHQGKKEEAAKLYYDVLETREKVLGSLHPSTLSTKNQIAMYLSDPEEKL